MNSDQIVVIINRSDIFSTILAIIIAGAVLLWATRALVSKARAIKYAGTVERDVVRKDPPLTLALTLKAYASDLILRPGSPQPSVGMLTWHLEFISRRVDHIATSAAIWQNVDSEVIRKLVINSDALYHYWPSVQNGSPRLDATFDYHLREIIKSAETIAAAFRVGSDA